MKNKFVAVRVWEEQDVLGFLICKNLPDNSFYIPLIQNPSCTKLYEGNVRRSDRISFDTQKDLLEHNKNCTFINELNLDELWQLSDGTKFISTIKQLDSVVNTRDYVII